MAIASLKYLAEQKLLELRSKIAENRDRYSAGDFLDLSRDNGWGIETTGVLIDTALLDTLDGTAKTAAADIENSLIVHKALKGLTPALAMEERLWARLTHIECLGYCRGRWLTGNKDEKLDDQVRLHMFAPGRARIRDDNALSRLWWNVHIATIADPDDPEGALRLILKTSDVRSNFIERIGTSSRNPLARAVIRAMRREPWITSSEASFRSFMIALNRDGGGLLFEALEQEISDKLMDECTVRAQTHLKASKSN